MIDIGFNVYNNYTGDAKYRQTPSINSKYCYSKLTIILMCLRGKAKFNVGFTEYEISEDSFLCIAAGKPFYYLECSEDLALDIFTITEEMMDKAAQGLIKVHFYSIVHKYPFQRISKVHTEMCHNIHQYLIRLLDMTDNFFQKQILLNYINILLYEACNIMLHSSNGNDENLSSRNRDIASRFISLLEKNITVSRKVEFYAEQIGMTPKYLSTMVKEATRRNASEWIDDYSLMEAKTRLKSNKSTIQNISYDLGFATPSHFAKFFKDKTGVTPREFRKK